MMTKWVLLAHLAATGWMIGLIWFVQVVHYPLFSLVGTAQSARYARAHQRRTTWVVVPAMLVELSTGLWLLWDRPLAMPAEWAVAGVALLAVIWVSTLLLQVPCHRRLKNGFDAQTHRLLVAGNRVRTAAWSMRGLILLVVLARMI